MATLNLKEKKMMSDDNLRLFANLLLSLSSKVQSAEDKLINNWIASTAYIKDESFVIYDELLYVCKISNADNTFDKNKWTCLSPIIEELTKSDIEALVNLTPEQITNLQSLIDDTSISTTHTNSSSHIYMAIQDAIVECKDDTLKQIAKKVSGSYKIANTTADIVSTDYIYLLSNGTNYDLYVLVDGTATKVGDTNIDLSDYAKISDLDEYLKSVDADGKFATITTVDGKMDSKPIATLIGNDNVETHDQLVSAKAVAELKRRTFSRPSGESILGYADSIDTSNDNISVTVRSMDCPDAPYGTTGTVSNDCYYTIHKIYATNDYCVIEAKDIRTNNKYIRMKTGGTWYDWVGILEQGNVVNMCNLSNGGHTAISSWVDSTSDTMIMSFDIVDADDKICRIQFDYNTGTFYSFKFDGTNWNSTGHYCVTTVNNISPKSISSLCTYPTALTVEINNSKYTVKNGFCTVNVVLKVTSCTSGFGWTVVANDLPKASYLGNTTLYPEAGGTIPLCVQVTDAGVLKFRVADAITTPTWFTGSFTYPVAES